MRVHGERGLVVQATPVALSQVLSTLLENSLVHGRGTVDVHARRSGPSVVVEVSDQGDGVPAAIAPHIFERSVTHDAAPASAWRWRATSPSPTAAGSSSSRPSRRSSRCSSASPTRPEASRRGARTATGVPWRSAPVVLGQRRGVLERLLAEHEPPVGPEPEQRAEPDADDLGDVVGDRLSWPRT